MIVLFNVKITDVRMGYPYTRGTWMPDPCRFDIFKYCLASTAVLNPLVSKFVFCITMAPELAHRQAELDAYIRELFPADKLDLTWARNDFGRDWRRTCDRVLSDPDELVWLACNDDHIFIDRDLDIVKAAISTLNADLDPNAIMYYSHWPEQMRMSVHLGGTVTEDKNFIKFQWENFDGIMILKAGRLSKYWERDYGDNIMFKVDYLGAHHGYKCPGTVYAPTRELVRHYEGYSHVNQNMPQTLANTVPPLFVPPGFFDCEMKIRIGYSERDDSATNFYAAAERLYNVDPNGTDYRWTVEDVPLFWKHHIADVDVNLDQDIHGLKQARDAAFLASTRVPMGCFGVNFDHTNSAPNEWFTNHLLTATIN